MAYSTQRTTSDGTLVALDLAIEYLDRSEIAVILDGVVSTAWSWVGTTEKRIEFPSALALGTDVLIVRTTDLSGVRHVFEGGAAFTYSSIDENYEQILHIAQEARENATLSDVYGDIDMHGFQIKNTAPATEPTDLVTFSQFSTHDAQIIIYRDQCAGYALAAAASATVAEEAAASLDVSGFLVKANNLSDIADPAVALANLGGIPSANPAFTTPIVVPSVQVGQAVDTGANFILRTPVPGDGTFVLARGNGSVVLAVDAAGNLTLQGALRTTVHSMVRLNTANGHGTTNTKYRRFLTLVTSIGDDITYADSASLGASFTINTTGVYSVTYTDQFNLATYWGLSLNSTQPTTNINSITPSSILNSANGSAASQGVSVNWTGRLAAGDVIHAHTTGAASGVNTWAEQFTIAKVG